jgi:ketosteroid isomerase-like protein
MSEENVEVVRRGLELFNRGEVDTVIRDILHDEIEITPGIGPLLGVATVRGKENVRKFWVEDLPQGFDEFRIEPRAVEDLGRAILVESHYRARGPRTGIELEQTFTTVYVLRDGRIQSIRDCPSRDEALEAAGLSE